METDVIYHHWNESYSLYVIAKTMLFSFPTIIILLFAIFLKINKISKNKENNK